MRLGMTAADARTKLGEPAMKSNEQDFFVVSPNETTQIVYDVFQKVVTISTDYAGGVGAPDYKAVVGEGMLLSDLMVHCSEWCSIRRRVCGSRTTRAPLWCR